MVENMSWKSWVLTLILACINVYGTLSGPVADWVGHDLNADVISSGLTSCNLLPKSIERGLI